MELSRILNTRAGVPAKAAAVHEEYSNVHATLPASPVASSTDTDGGLRVGKWTDEEERFSLELIKHFLAGALTAPTGISLRAFMAKQLRCSPMRISTKLAMDTLGGERIPKRLGQKRFFPMDTVSAAERRQIAMDLHDLEVAFLEKEGIDPSTALNTVSSAAHAHHSDDESVTDDNGAAVRVGSWSDEEQTYAAALIDGFLRGHLHLEPGTTLRAFLAERLCCNPMRISKKLATGMMGNQALPKRLGSATFHPARDISQVQVARTEDELAQLRDACFSPVKTQVQDDRMMYGEPSSPQHVAPHSPMNPASKKRFFSQTHQTLPPLLEACKKSRYPSMYALEMY